MQGQVLKQYCLQTMGITQWQRKTWDYFVVVDVDIDNDKRQLLQRIMQALKWPANRTKTEVIKDHPDAAAYFSLRLNKLLPKKVLLFSPGLSAAYAGENPAINVALLPTLTALGDINVKKQAWKVMQNLTN
jgi:hypothetical protein